MTQDEIDWATWCAHNDTAAFYNSPKWKRKRKEILAADHNECQCCKVKYHRYRPADTVHHINHFRDRPDLALEATYRDPATHTDKRNLISLCHECHEEAHGYRMGVSKTQPISEERWD